MQTETQERVAEVLRRVEDVMFMPYAVQKIEEAAQRIEKLERQLCELQVFLDAERRATAQRIEELEQQLHEMYRAARAVLAEVSSGGIADSLAVINLRRAVTQ